MKLIADRLAPNLAPRVSFVSVMADLEHDRPSRLLDYARALDANVSGWYFLTGSPSQIDTLMRALQLGRHATAAVRSIMFWDIFLLARTAVR